MLTSSSSFSIIQFTTDIVYQLMVSVLKEQSRLIEEEILNVKADSKGKVGRVCAMKKKLNGGKKEGQEPVAVRDPDTDELVTAAEDIKEVTLRYCETNLKKEVEDIILKGYRAESEGGMS